jgi:hypothetical protein
MYACAGIVTICKKRFNTFLKSIILVFPNNIFKIELEKVSEGVHISEGQG